MDKVPKARAVIQSQYRCELARKFKATSYCHKNPNIGLDFDYFEDIDDLQNTSLSDTSNTLSQTVDTLTKECAEKSSDESVVYVFISFYVLNLYILS